MKEASLIERRAARIMKKAEVREKAVGQRDREVAARARVRVAQPPEMPLTLAMTTALM